MADGPAIEQKRQQGLQACKENFDTDMAKVPPLPGRFKIALDKVLLGALHTKNQTSAHDSGPIHAEAEKGFCQMVVYEEADRALWALKAAGNPIEDKRQQGLLACKEKFDIAMAKVPPQPGRLKVMLDNVLLGALHTKNQTSAHKGGSALAQVQRLICGGDVLLEDRRKK
jgi:hypothetical protein